MKAEDIDAMLARHERHRDGWCRRCVIRPWPCDAVTAGLALRDALVEVTRLRSGEPIALDLTTVMLAQTNAGEERDLAVRKAEVLNAEVQRWVDAHSALACQVDGLLSAGCSCNDDECACVSRPLAWTLDPCATYRAAIEGAEVNAGVPMSQDMGHDLRERIARAIDQAWAEARDWDRLDGGYRDGYLDGLEAAEGIARTVSLTGDIGPMSTDDDTEVES